MMPWSSHEQLLSERITNPHVCVTAQHQCTRTWRYIRAPYIEAACADAVLRQHAEHYRRRASMCPAPTHWQWRQPLLPHGQEETRQQRAARDWPNDRSTTLVCLMRGAVLRHDLHALSTTGIAFEAACTFASASLRYSFGRGNVANKLQAVDLKTSRAWPQRASRYILVYTYCKLIKSCSFRMALEPNCVNGVYLHLFGHEDFAARRRKATCTCLDPCAAYFIALLEDEALNYAILRRDGPRRVKQANRLYRANSSWTR
jgi:hypothetical protein